MIESWRDVLVLVLCCANGCLVVPALLAHWRAHDAGLGVLVGLLVALEPYLVWLYVRLAWHL